MSKHRDTMRALTEARPDRLEPDSPPVDPGVLMAYPRNEERPRKRVRRLAVAGVAMAAAVAVGVTVLAQPDPSPVTKMPAAEEPATDLLLAAASRAEAAPQRTGRYWVIRAEHGGEGRRLVEERWFAVRDSDPSSGYFRDESGTWTARPMRGRHTFLLAGQERSMAELAALPSDPDQLKTKLLQWHRDGNRDEYLFYAGVGLTLDLPTSPGVRAAAYRMLAGLPRLDRVGTVTDPLGRGGIAVGYSRRGDSGAMSQQRLVIDPESGRALALESWTGGKLMLWDAMLHTAFSDSPLPEATSLR
ncbi:CU044_5270 family protein [Actinoplanes sp. NPDC051861]|uniref:CU044_5270 family protein n=1 Tax=Actinoplanes sp. NPDC051861 TaxID=3155170 RepID=UPI003448B538